MKEVQRDCESMRNPKMTNGGNPSAYEEARKPGILTQSTKPSLPLPVVEPAGPKSDDSGGIQTPKLGITVVKGY